MERDQHQRFPEGLMVLTSVGLGENSTYPIPTGLGNSLQCRHGQETDGTKWHSKGQKISRSASSGRFTTVRHSDAKTAVKSRHPDPRPPRDRSK
jgi:hypothetical protein